MERISPQDLLSTLPVAVESQGAELTSGEVAQVESLFASLDQDHSGVLERKEFLRLHGQDSTGFYHLLDTDGDGDISMAEWIRYARVLKAAAHTTPNPDMTP